MSFTGYQVADFLIRVAKFRMLVIYMAPNNFEEFLVVLGTHRVATLTDYLSSHRSSSA
jgi:hypothetical protein